MKKRELAIRWHSRAGQGAIMAANFLAKNLFKLGYHATSFPDFGAEKRGAAVKVFNKISRENENFAQDVAQPLDIDIVVLVDQTLAEAELGYEKVLSGLKDDGFFLINSKDKNLNNFPEFSGSLYTINAYQIAKETIARNIPNVTIVGSLVKILDLDRLKSRENLKDHLSAVFSEKIVEMNLISFDRGYEEVVKIF